MYQKIYTFKTLDKYLADTAKLKKDSPAYFYRKNNEWESVSYNQLVDKSINLARGLSTLNVKKGSKVAIYSENNIDWIYTFFACQYLGAIPVGIYQNSSLADVKFIIEDSKPDVIAVGDLTIESFESIKEDMGSIKKIKLGQKTNLNDYTFVKNLFLSEDFNDELIFNVNNKLEDVAQIVYSFGTNIRPKGVMISHNAINYSAFHLLNYAYSDWGKESILSFMPFAGIAESLMCIYSVAILGYKIHINDKASKIYSDISEVNPSYFTATSYFWDKIRYKIEQEINNENGIRGFLLRKLTKCLMSNVADKEGLLEGYDYKANSLFRLTTCKFKHNVLFYIPRKMLLKKLKKQIGFDKANALISAGTNQNKGTLMFLSAIGLKLIEVYGLTETTGTAFFNTRDESRHGFFGKGIDSDKSKISEDSELLIKGPFLFSGYINNEAAFMKSFTEDGYYKTGDLFGVDEDGYYKYLGKKNANSHENVNNRNIVESFQNIDGISYAYSDNHGAGRDIYLFVDDFGFNRLYNILSNKNSLLFSRQDILNSQEMIDYIKDHINKDHNLSYYKKEIHNIVICGDVPTSINGYLSPNFILKDELIKNLINNKTLNIVKSYKI